jgi:hypothetical protein
MSRYPQRRDPRTGKTYYCHRAVAEWHLGRLLEPGEVVHHENEIKSDGHPLNLRVFSSQSKHMLYHHYRRREARGVQHLWELEAWLELHG